MDESALGAIGLAVTLRDAHFQLKALARAWEDRLPAGTVRGSEPLGPTWHYGDDPGQAAYHDGRLLLLAEGRSLTCELTVDFGVDRTDILTRAAWEDEDQKNGGELARIGPLEYPGSASELTQEIRRCVRHLEVVDLSVLTG